MQIDYALILSAGLGTRMGEIGKHIPKVLWPIFNKSLLELQIRYCEDLGIKNIYINTHFLHEEIVLFLKANNLDKKVKILHEDPLLDSGGAIHNLANRPDVNYQGNLLLVNGDQFLFFDDKLWEKAIERIQNNRAILFGIKVNKDASYNETVTNEDKLIEIRKNISKQKEYITYSGLGLLNLNGLKPVDGISRFFETVANYKNESIELLTPDNFEYWDFGTAEIYFSSIKNLMKATERKGKMGIFLKKHSAFFENESNFINTELNSIDLENKGRFTHDSIVAKGLTQII